jgi:hypothetical protein
VTLKPPLEVLGGGELESGGGVISDRTDLSGFPVTTFLQGVLGENCDFQGFGWKGVSLKPVVTGFLRAIP